MVTCRCANLSRARATSLLHLVCLFVTLTSLLSAQVVAGLDTFASSRERVYDVRLLVPGVGALRPQYTAYVTTAAASPSSSSSSLQTRIRLVPRTSSGRVEDALVRVAAWLRLVQVRVARTAVDTCPWHELEAAAAEADADAQPHSTRELVVHLTWLTTHAASTERGGGGACAHHLASTDVHVQCNEQLLRHAALPHTWLPSDTSLVSLSAECAAHVLRDVYEPALPLSVPRHTLRSADAGGATGACAAVSGWAVSEVQLHAVEPARSDKTRVRAHTAPSSDAAVLADAAPTLVVRMRLTSTTATPLPRACWVTIEAAPQQADDKRNTTSSTTASRTSMFVMLAVVAATRMLPRVLARRQQRGGRLSAAAIGRRRHGAGALDAAQRARVQQRIAQLLQKVKDNKDKQSDVAAAAATAAMHAA